MEYRKKTPIVKAIQLRIDTWYEICDFIGIGRLVDGRPEGCFIGEDGEPLPKGSISKKIGLKIPLPECVILARENDYIIRDAHGCFYVLDSSTFECNYELYTKE